MPAPKRYPTPEEQLVELGHRARKEGLTFEEFWNRAVPAAEVVIDKATGEPVLDDVGDPKIKPSRVLPRHDTVDPPEGAILWPRDTRLRRDAYEVVLSGKEIWRRSYEGLPLSRRERAIRALRPLPEDPDDVGDRRGRSSGAGVPLPA